MQGESGYYYGVFWEGMPDLNLRNPEVTAQIEDIARFWLEDVGVDGFRLDGARHLIEDGAKQVNTPDTHAWFKQFHDFYKSVNPDAMTVGEVWDSVVAAAPYVRDGEMDLVFNFELASTLHGRRERPQRRQDAHQRERHPRPNSRPASTAAS